MHIKLLCHHRYKFLIQKSLLNNNNIISEFMVIPLTVWKLATQFLQSIYMPVYFKQLKEKKWKMHLLHVVSSITRIKCMLIT